MSFYEHKPTLIFQPSGNETIQYKSGDKRVDREGMLHMSSLTLKLLE